jgi:hypothetical protein
MSISCDPLIVVALVCNIVGRMWETIGSDQRGVFTAEKKKQKTKKTTKGKSAQG